MASFVAHLSGRPPSGVGWWRRSRPGRLLAAGLVVAGLACGAVGGIGAGHAVGPTQAYGGTWSATRTPTVDVTVTADPWAGWGAGWQVVGGAGTISAGGATSGGGVVIQAAGSTWS